MSEQNAHQSIQNANNQESHSIPLMPLRSFFCDMITIPSSQTKGMRAVVVTDSHIGKFSPGEPQIAKLYDYLQEAANKSDANMAVWLGDIIDIKAANRTYIAEQFVEKFSEFPIPIHFISGNHDRSLYRKMETKGNLNYHDTKILKFEPSEPNQRPIFFAHDFGNPFRIPKPQVPSFIYSNKVAQESKMSKDDWLIIGHVHTLYKNEIEKIASLPPFSIDLSSFGYGLVIDTEKGFCISFHHLNNNNKSTGKND